MKFKLHLDRLVLKQKESKSSILNSLLWLTPALILVVMFSYFAIFTVFKSSTNEYESYWTYVFTFKNYGTLFRDKSFLIALRNSLIFVVTVIPISLFLSILISKFISNILNKKAFSFFQTIFFIPYVTSTIAVTMAFAIIFSPSGGILNSILQSLGIGNINWFSKGWALVMILIFGIWTLMPFQILLLTGSFVRVNNKYYRAASIDGMSNFKQLFKITLPLIRQTIFYLITLGIISSFKIFPIGLFESYNQTSLLEAQTLVSYIYDRLNGIDGIRDYKLSSTASVVLMFIILLMTIINSLISKRVGR
ncbi:multiple sugar transport system permease protein [Spiroplasma sp. TIUS-1]|uniref:carbohydrate ABC transporter permease n=1 Tax=Spiroplasma sp. TIUS-1 TaxID=216963 RepID=UPI001398AE4F|nr:sugar ABC transporter permease [Spiroplasma sp. TIUS-1]QHX35668.1 multiple sugar transport system permease protein [Spiroplasma sp. TIUS-1]